MNAVFYHVCQCLLATPLLVVAWLVWSAATTRSWPEPGALMLLASLMTVSAAVLGLREWLEMRHSREGGGLPAFARDDYSAA